MKSPSFGFSPSSCTRFFSLIILFLFFSRVFSQNANHIATVSSDSVLNKQVELFLNQSKYREATRLIEKHLKGSTASSPNHLLYYSNKMSFAQLRLRNLDSAMLLARQSLALLRGIHDSTLVSDAWRMAAYSYNNIGKLDSALHFTRLLLDYAGRRGDLRQKRNALVSLATILSQNREYGQALACYRDADKITYSISDTLYAPISDYNIGLTFLNLKQTDSCLFYLHRAAKSAIRTKRSDVLVYIYGTMADCYLTIDNLAKRKHYLMLANTEAEKIGNKQFLAMGLSNLAQGALMQKDFREAVHFGEQSLKLLKEQPYPVLKMKVDSMLAVAYQGTGNFEAAYQCQKTYIAEREQIVGKQQREQLDQLRVKLEVQEKDLTITRQTLEITNKKGKIQTLTLLVALCLILVVGQTFYVLRARAFRRKLFRKEKEFDRYTEDMRRWVAWKNTQGLQESGMKAPGESNFPEHETEIHTEVSAQAVLFSELREIFTSRKLYLDPELNLKTVIKLLGTNKKYLYQAISENSDENFRSFINRYRVDEAKRIMEEKIGKSKEINLAELYTLAGFNSSVSFYRAFRAITGLTPKEYLKEIRRPQNMS